MVPAKAAVAEAGLDAKLVGVVLFQRLLLEGPTADSEAELLGLGEVEDCKAAPWPPPEAEETTFQLAVIAWALAVPLATGTGSLLAGRPSSGRDRGAASASVQRQLMPACSDSEMH